MTTRRLQVPRETRDLASQPPAWQRCFRGYSSPGCTPLQFGRLLRWGELRRWYATYDGSTETELKTYSSENKPSGRNSARKPLED